MKYTTQVIIDLPREKVIELFDNDDNMKHWQDGLISMELLSGEAGKEGARSQLHYKMGKRDVKMIETITKRNFPHEFSATYDAKGVWNLQQNFFDALGEDKTVWRSESEFKFRGFMKIMAFIMPGAFRNQTLKMMERFKEFAEKQ